MKGHGAKFGLNWEEREFKEMFDIMDTNKDGIVDFNEFIVAGINKVELLSRENIRRVFVFMDKDKNGVISKDELKIVF